MLLDAAPCRFTLDVGDPATLPPAPSRVRLQLDTGKIERGLVKLVLSLVEMIRQLMEKQAMRRIDAGSLNADEIERVGRSLMELEAAVRQLQDHFGIDDLNMDLGPAGMLLNDHA